MMKPAVTDQVVDYAPSQSDCDGSIAAQIQGRTKSLYSTMKKLLRLDDVAKGGRGRDEVYDLLGLRVIVTPYPDAPVEEGELAATQVWLPCTCSNSAVIDVWYQSQVICTRLWFCSVLLTVTVS